MFSAVRNTALAAVAVAIGLALVSPAHADLLLFQLKSSSGDTASWEQQSNPTPTNPGGVVIEINVLNGTETTAELGTDSVTSVVFRPSDDEGGFSTVTHSETTMTNSSYVQTLGPQLFTGPLSSPIFSPQTVTLTYFWPLPDGRSDPSILTITDTSVPAPEPASLPLLVIGLAGLGLVVRTGRA